ncbi:metallophosphoesterase [Paenibacillus sp. tmac-D7]|uniref:metallophosphoesterase n=1 Tax=Paenibacillus sp. tmac-D7 TaxID=2591462 RepID=UPI00114123BB|nr:metallophosphoesterase [Paenibacillus sp. tmac-D7]
MRIGILSDLHVDKNNDDEFGTVQEALCSAASATNTDLLIVAGDISNNYVQTLNVLEEIEERAGIPCLFVPGNHDIWYSRSVKYAVCGHVHYRKKISIGSTQFICNCLGDKKEWLHSKRAYEEVSKSYVTIDI